MNATKFLATIGCALALVAMAALWRTNQNLQAAQAQLAASAQKTDQEMAALKQDIQRLSAKSPQSTPSTPSEEPNRDILKLRADNSELRQRIAKLEEARQSPTATNAPPPLVYPDSTRRSDYKNAGYASPREAVETHFWAISQLNPQAYLDSLAPGDQRIMTEQQFVDLPPGVMPGGFRNGAMYRATGIKVTEDIQITEDTRHLKVFLEGQNTVLKPILKRIGNDWKWAGQRFRDDP